MYIYMCVCGVLWDLFCPHLCCPQASIVRSFWDQDLVRSGATDGRGLAVCVYVTVNNINMGVIYFEIVFIYVYVLASTVWITIVK